MGKTYGSVRINFVAGRSRRLFGCFVLLSLFFVFSLWEFGCFFGVLERKPICYWVFPFLFLLVRLDARTGWQRRLAWGNFIFLFQDSDFLYFLASASRDKSLNAFDSSQASAP